MKKFLVLTFAMFALIGVGMAAEFNGYVKKIDGNKITVTKVKKGEKTDDVTLDLAEKVKVVKNKQNPETKKSEAGDVLEDGLKNEAFKKDDPFIRVITDDANTVVEIRVIQKKS